MLEKTKEGIAKALEHLEVEFSRLQLGRANPLLVEDIMIEQYGSLQALKNVASVGVMDAQTLQIKPWDKTILNEIAKAISDSGKGLNPQVMADGIMIKIPQLTQERRTEMVKIVKKLSEEGKISIRNVRGDMMKEVKKLEDSKEISEDERKDLEEKIQKEITQANKTIEERTKKKETDIMTV